MRGWLGLGLLCAIAASCVPAVPSGIPFDRDKLKITLSRTGCLGSCPAYDVTIEGNGLVTFRADAYDGGDEPEDEFDDDMFGPSVALVGVHRAQIDPASVDALIEKFRTANFLALRDEYNSQTFDIPSQTIRLDTGRRIKSVWDHGGEDVGMPQSVSDLQDAIDQTAGSARWVVGSNGLIEALAAEKFDFRSPEAARALFFSIPEGGDATLREFVVRGAPLEAGIGGKTYGERILLHAIRHGRAPLFELLAKRGWLDRVESVKVHTAFALYGAGCNPAMAAAGLRWKIPVDARVGEDNGGWDEARGATALQRAVSWCTYFDDEQARVATIRFLIERGADPSLKNLRGESAMTEAEDPATRALLQRKGAARKSGRQ